MGLLRGSSSPVRAAPFSVFPRGESVFLSRGKPALMRFATLLPILAGLIVK